MYVKHGLERMRRDFDRELLIVGRSLTVGFYVSHNFYENVMGKDKLSTYRHFAVEATSKATIYRIIRRYELTGETKFLPNKGRPAVKSSPRKVRKVEKVFTRTPTISLSAASRKPNMDRSTLRRIKVHKLGITARTRKKAPKYVKDQENGAKKGCRKVYEKTREKVLIIDDESYVFLDPAEAPGRRFVHARDHTQLKFEDRSKFPTKFLVWQALDENGNVSEPFITDQNINADVYLEECLKRRLLPFISEHYEMDDIIFWPDLATSRYANIVKAFLEDNKVSYVAKNTNPTNVPQARGIEKVWANCKTVYHARPQKAKNIRGFKLIWPKSTKTVGKDCGKEVMEYAAKFPRGIGYKGIRKALIDLSNKNIY